MRDSMRPAKRLDVRGLLCPIPVLEGKKAIDELAVGQLLELIGDDPVMVIDVPAWCDQGGHGFVGCEKGEDGVVRCLIEKGPA